METRNSHLYEYLLNKTRKNKKDQMKDILLNYSAYKEENNLDAEYIDNFVNSIIKYLKDDAIEEVLIIFSEIRRYIH
jgi:hypothetical protein